MSLWQATAARGGLAARCIRGYNSTVTLSDLVAGSSLNAPLDTMRGSSVLVATEDQITAALALIELDGIARRIILCPPDLASEHLPYVMATAEVDAVVSDSSAHAAAASQLRRQVSCSPRISPAEVRREPGCQSEWILFTSGTTGVPKMVVHTLSSLAGAIQPGGPLASPVVWSTFYDIRRYGGLQILLRALLGGGSLVLSDQHETMGDFLARAARHGATHLTGTPSHWRRALMTASARGVSPRYARLSGEIADQGILDNLRSFYPGATVAHAFASTEAGVGFEVDDGLAGFPAGFVGRTCAGVELKVDDGSLRIRSSRAALRYVGDGNEVLVDEDGYVDTGDMLELRGSRYYFVGRRGGIINVGGLKVHPEEIEGVINGHPRVRMSLVKARKNPITGAIVVADVVVIPGADDAASDGEADDLKKEILDACRSALAPHKVPALLKFVPSLEVTPSGKILRHA